MIGAGGCDGGIYGSDIDIDDVIAEESGIEAKLKLMVGSLPTKVWE